MTPAPPARGGATVIRNVVFDIGRVIVHLDPRPIIEFMQSRAAPCDDLASLIAHIPLEDHECGRVDGEGLLKHMQSLTQPAATIAELHAKWLDMFQLEPDMAELARRLSSHYRVYLLSNVGDLHWTHLCREYALDRLGHGVLTSFLAGSMKPHAAIYAEAERRFTLEPAATVFIDDRPENIAAARDRGWHGIVHGSFSATRDALRSLGVAA
jgi:HAD superfamily hydrolase (TIGR01509 family)